MERNERNDEQVGDQERPYVPIELEPCALKEWLNSHSDWVLFLPPTMSAQEITALYQRHVSSSCPDTGILSEIADHPNCPRHILVELGKPRWRCTHLYLSINPNVPVEILHRLARSRDFNVVLHVAWNPSTAVDDLRWLIQRSNWDEVREAAQSNLAKQKREE